MRLITAVAVVLVVLGYTTEASAQGQVFLISGRMIEVGGASMNSPSIKARSVASNGTPTEIATYTSCVDFATINCIQADGTFTVGMPTQGLFTLEFTAPGHITRTVPVNLSIAANVGTIELGVTPYQVNVGVGIIGRNGGNVGVYMRLIPQSNFNDAIKAQLMTWSQLGSGIANTDLKFVRIPMDSYTPQGGALATMNVPASAPPGSYHCASVTLWDKAQETILGYGYGCAFKQP